MKNFLAACWVFLAVLTSAHAQWFSIATTNDKVSGPFQFKEGSKIQVGTQSVLVTNIITGRQRAQEMVKGVVIPEIEFRQANIFDVFLFLQTACAEYSTGRTARVTFKLDLPPQGISNDDDVVPLTFGAKNMSVLEALNLIVGLARLAYEADGDDVIRITRRTGMRNQALKGEQDIRNWLEWSGIHDYYLDHDDKTGKYYLRIENESIADLSTLAKLPLTGLALNNCRFVTDLSPLAALPLTSLDLCRCPNITDLSPLKNLPLASLGLYSCTNISDLSPLKNLPLTSFNLSRCSVTNLSALKGMPLVHLSLDGDKISDISPLKGMRLKTFDVTNARDLTDFSPLKDMPLEEFSINLPGPLRDLSVLEGAPLRIFYSTRKQIDKAEDVLKSLESLQTIGWYKGRSWTPKEYWEMDDADAFPKDSTDEER